MDRTSVQWQKIQRLSAIAETETGGGTEKRGGEREDQIRDGLILNPGDWRGLDETRGDEKPRNARWCWRAEWRQIKTRSTIRRHPIQLRPPCFGIRFFFSRNLELVLSTIILLSSHVCFLSFTPLSLCLLI